MFTAGIDEPAVLMASWIMIARGMLAGLHTLFRMRLARTHGLVESDIHRLISPWHTDADLGRPLEVVTDMSKSRRMGFLDYQASDDAFYDLFATLRAQRLIP